MTHSAGYKQSHKVSRRSLVSLSVYNVGQQKCTPGYQWGPGVRDHYLIHYVLSGKGEYRIRRAEANRRDGADSGTPAEKKAGGAQTAGPAGKSAELRFALSAGDLFLVRPDTEILYRADGEDPWEYQWVGFAGADAASMLDATEFTPERPVLRRVPYGGELSRCLREISEAFGNSFCSSVEMTGRLCLALSLLMRPASSSPEENAERANVRTACSYIDSHFAYNISIESVAAYAGVSRSTLYRQFIAALGQSPKRYLDAFRIRRACLLLTETGLSVSAISNSVGFQSPLYFSKAFRKMMNLSPGEYRSREKSR
ncbi:AraC family transcriptional regulator [Lachnoclostridium sp. Marseille-P6806]|uniref:AraC family transcriptional regulator n=1 Tax=Lachnoclostridium sp. Marseille-P6806 TaxID=2364793 RepID=UPI0010310ED2|nr:AraC family transcriptional regulator [Lachnoclostridium sp. Marseille-P6806]